MLSVEDRSKYFQDIIDSCKYILQHDQIALEAKSYLDSRIPKQFQSQFEFGYFPDNNHISYLTSLCNVDTLQQTGTIYPKMISGGSSLSGHFTHHNLIFPFKDMYGNIISLVGRTFFDKERQEELQIPKYKYSYGLNKELYLFGLHHARKHILNKNFVILVEGQLDYFSCIMHGIHNVVALGGASFTRYQFFKLRRYTNNFMLLLDNDEAGQRGSAKAQKYYKEYANFQNKQLPSEYKDIDETLVKADIYRKQQIINNLQQW